MAYPATYEFVAFFLCSSVASILCQMRSWFKTQCQGSSMPWLHDKSVFSCSRQTVASSQMLFVPFTDNYSFYGSCALQSCSLTAPEHTGTFMSKNNIRYSTTDAERKEILLAANEYRLRVDSDQQISHLIMTHFSYALLIVLSSVSCSLYSPLKHTGLSSSSSSFQL